jgi:hypothetical protein
MKHRLAVASRLPPHALRPIVEFYPLAPVPSAKGARTELFDFATPHGKALRAELEAARGLYIFYNSQCRAIYLGKAKRMNLWYEMKSAFNRRRKTQIVRKVNHGPSKGPLQFAYEKPRRIAEHEVLLFEVARYVSVYEVGTALIDNLEALLMRAFPNEITNAVMAHIRVDPA